MHERAWDQVWGYADAGGEDTLVFGAGIGVADLILKRSRLADGVSAGDDLIVTVREGGVMTGDEVRIQDWFADGNRIEWFAFADGQKFRIGDFQSILTGTDGPDVLIGTEGDDWVYGGSGDDRLELLPGDDVGIGAEGNDQVAGDAGRDLIIGGTGDGKRASIAANDNDQTYNRERVAA